MIIHKIIKVGGERALAVIWAIDSVSSLNVEMDAIQTKCASRVIGA